MRLSLLPSQIGGRSQWPKQMNIVSFVRIPLIEREGLNRSSLKTWGMDSHRCQDHRGLYLKYDCETLHLSHHLDTVLRFNFFLLSFIEMLMKN